VEPVTTPTVSNVLVTRYCFLLSVLTRYHCCQDKELLYSERKDSVTPLKKNRRRLDPTVEEEDNGSGSGGSGSTTPPILVSPRQEMRIKVRQISQGVEDISWKNMQHAYDKDEDVEIDSLSEATLEPALKLTTQKDKVNCRAVMDGDDSSPTTPDISLLSQSIQNVQDDATTSNLSPNTPTRPRKGSDSGEKGLKRKFLERGTSQGPADEESNHVPEPLKRPRDESDKDDNPRETKRPSPPPSPPKPSPPKAHKPVCCSCLYC
jgi:Ran-binding protein 3